MSTDIAEDKILNSSSVQTYLNHLQNTIARMATHSMHTKTTCGAINAAILMFGSRHDISFIVLGFPIIISFCFLDCCYLALEKGYRDKFNNFVSSIKNGVDIKNDLFDMAPPKKYMSICSLIKAFKSWSVWIFYSILTVMIFLAS